MNERINISLSIPKGAENVLLKTEMPTEVSEMASLKYTREEVKGDWGKVSIKRWVMSGLCVAYEDLDTLEGAAPELGISGPHVSILCYGGGVSPSSPFSGTVEIQRTARTLTRPFVDAKGKRLSIIFSLPFLSKLLQDEPWIKSHILSGLLDTASENRYQYFLELPVRHILNALLNEQINAAQKGYYFELKLKELFFMLHLQHEISSLEAPIPVDIHQKLIAARAYLLANYHVSPTIKQLSRIVSLNEFKLKQFFKILFGITIKSYIIALRMEEAKDLLLKNHSVGDIAARLGYKNVSHFILVFKRTFSETPRQMIPKLDKSRNTSSWI